MEVPAGRYRIAGHLSIPANVTLQGTYRVAPTPGPLKGGVPEGSVLLAFEGRGSTNGSPFLRLAGNNAALAGLVIAYPEWKQTDVPPVPYPPCVLAEGPENVGVRDCCLLNPYEGMRFVRAARHLVRNVTGYPIKRGILVDECYDIGHIENVHFWPFGVAYQPEDPYCKWVNTESVAFELARTDWHYVLNTFCFGYGIGYKFSKSAQGSANGNFLGLGADSCQRAVVVEQAQPPGLLISNGEFVGRWGSTNAICLEIGPEVEGTVSLVNCSFWGPIDRCVWMRSLGGQFTASACHFLEWDNGLVNAPAIQLDAGKAIVQACTFHQDKVQVVVGTNVTSAILMANQAEGGFRVRNGAGKRTQQALNEEDALEWSPEARAHYEIQVGASGDARYLEAWHGPEKGAPSYRWSGAVSRLVLPIVAGRPYTLHVEWNVPTQALAPEAGVYLDGKQLAPLRSEAAVDIALPPGTGESVRLELRSPGWVPKRVLTGSQDLRVLGVQVYRLTMRAAGSTNSPFRANTFNRVPLRE